MKKVLVLLAVAAVAAVTVFSCKKSDSGEDEINRVKSEILGKWYGVDQVIEINVSADYTITTGNFSIKIVDWTYKEGVGVSAILNDPANSVITVRVEGADLYLTTNSATLKAVLPGHLQRRVLT